MLIIAPYRFAVDHSSTLRRFIPRLSSETWSATGLTCASLAAVAGWFHVTTLYVGFLFLEVVCDFNDGWVYEYTERGISNGYGLYLDHVVDAVAAACATWGGYQLLGHGEACAIGLALYYALAIHSWLFKITQITRGQFRGIYYSLTISKGRGLTLSVDDLAVVICVAVIFRSVPAVYVINVALLCLFIGKVTRATRDLRRTMWRDVSDQRTINHSATQSQ